MQEGNLFNPDRMKSVVRAKREKTQGLTIGDTIGGILVTYNE